MQIKGLEEFEIYGISVRTKNSDETSGRGKIGALWQEFLSSSYNDIDGIYVLYHNYESDVNGKYSVLIGTKSPSKGSYEKASTNAGKYAVFSMKGSGAETTRALWAEIWSYFESSELKRAYKTDFEKHSDDKIEIFISVL